MKIKSALLALVICSGVSAADLSVNSFSGSGKANQVTVVVNPVKAGIKVNVACVGTGQNVYSVTDAFGAAKVNVPAGTKAAFVANLSFTGDIYNPSKNKAILVMF